MKRLFIVLYRLCVSFFALLGLSLFSLFLASYFHLTDVNGSIDSSTHILNNIARRLKNDELQSGMILGESTATTQEKITNLQEVVNVHIEKYCKLKVISYFAPDNASKMYEAYTTTSSDKLLDNMMSVVSFHLNSNQSYAAAIDNCSNNRPVTHETVSQQNLNIHSNIFPWYNDKENWDTLLAAILKDKEVINKAAKIGGIEARMLVAPLFVEQWRAYTSERELFKTILKPLQTLATSTTFSLGTMNIKEDVAQKIEENLKNRQSPYYLGPEYEHLLDFSTKDFHRERYARLANYRDHYYSYLYAALYLSEIEKQWSSSGYPISNRPEIVATLFNIGFSHSHPNASPGVGGSTIKVHGTPYTFGKLAYEFYYSGELMKEFPYIMAMNK